MPLTEAQIVDACARYAREYDRYAKLCETVASNCRRILKDDAIRGHITWRPKAPESFRKKLERINADLSKAPHYNSAEDVFQQMSDLAAVRVLTYRESDRSAIVQKLCENFAGRSDGKPSVEIKIKGCYRATHCIVELRSDDCEEGSPFWNLEGAHCEIQVSSMLAHVWNEIEHDIRYKPLQGTPGESEGRLLEALGSLAHSGDFIISELFDTNERRVDEHMAEFEDVPAFAYKMKKILDVERFNIHSGPLLDLLNDLKLNSLQKLKDLFAVTDDLSLKDKVMERANKVRDIASFDLDFGTSDILLAAVLLEKAADIASMASTGPGRRPRCVSLAVKYLQVVRQRTKTMPEVEIDKSLPEMEGSEEPLMTDLVGQEIPDEAGEENE